MVTFRIKWTCLKAGQLLDTAPREEVALVLGQIASISCCLPTGVFAALLLCPLGSGKKSHVQSLLLNP